MAGANDHAIFGYPLRLQLLGAMAPMAFGGASMLACVDADAPADGLCRAGEQATPGTDCLLCGERAPMQAMFARWTDLTARRGDGLNLSRGFMRPQMALAEPPRRAFGLPAFLSREAVDATRCHLDCASAKARPELGCTHPSLDALWPPIVEAERRLMAARRGLTDKLRWQPLVGG